MRELFRNLLLLARWGICGRPIRWYRDVVSHELFWKLYFEPRDLWIGIYWERDQMIDDFYLYLILIPGFPLRFVHQYDMEESE